MLTQPTPPEDDPDGGQPVPVAPITELITQTAQGPRPPPLPEQIPWAYADRVDAKRERLQVWAINASRASEARFNHGMGILSYIVPGQPILIGHHSERRHRRDLENVDRNMGASVALDKNPST